MKPTQNKPKMLWRAKVKKRWQGKGAPTVVGEKFSFGVHKLMVLKIILYVISAWIMVLLQTTFFGRFRPFGATPDILITFTAALAMFEGERAGAVCGTALGFTVAAVSGTGISLLPLLYMLCGYFCGAVCKYYMMRTALFFAIAAAGSLAARIFVSLIYITSLWRYGNLAASLTGILIPEFFSSLILSPLSILFTFPIWRLCRVRSRHTY